MKKTPAHATEAGRNELVQQAWGLLERRRLEHARRVIGEGLKRFPADAEMQYLGALLHWLADENGDALAAVRQLLAEHPEHYGGRSLLAKVLRELKQHPEAERIWIELLREYPENADAYAEYARLMLDNLDVAKAHALAAEGLRHVPEHPGCLFITSLVDVIRSPRARSEHLLTLVREHPDEMRTGIALAVALSHQRRHREALRVAQQLLRAEPGNPSLVEMVRELKVANHWSMLPLYPMQRWGWPAAVALWLGFVLVVPLLRGVLPPPAMATVSVVWLLYAIYSWVWPNLIRRFV
jgi:predicted Zn-dependent protease